MVIALDKFSIADLSDRMLLTGVAWETYQQLVAEVERSGRHYRLTFDSGDLEIELPSQIHEVVAAFLRSLIEAYGIAKEINFSPYGETTWSRRAVEKGLEADACYYVQNADLIGNRTDIDLDRDPPPDLAIEVEATRPLLPKLPVYAGMAIPEIWHVKTSGQIEILLLTDGRYTSTHVSRALPFFTIELLTRFTKLRIDEGHMKAIKTFLKELN